MKIFISQPMRDKSDEEIKLVREVVVKKLFRRYGDEEIEILDSFFEHLPMPEQVENKKIYYLGRSLELLSQADLVVFVDNWVNYTGCNIEHEVAFKYGVERAYINTMF